MDKAIVLNPKMFKTKDLRALLKLKEGEVLSPLVPAEHQATARQEAEAVRKELFARDLLKAAPKPATA